MAIGSTTAMLLGGALSAGGSLFGGMMGKSGANAAAGQVSAAGQQAALAAQHQQDLNTAASSPYTSLGSEAVDALGGLLGYGALAGSGQEGSGLYFDASQGTSAYNNELAKLQRYAGASGATMPTYEPVNYLTQVSDSFTADPSYDWRVSEGNKALDRSAASSGMLLSGAQAKGLTEFNQNAASAEYGNWWNRFLNQNEFNRLANAQNFGQQEVLYENQYGQWRDALGDLFRTAGIGQSSAANTAGTNSNLVGTAGNYLTRGAGQAADYTAQGGAAMASGVGSGINNLITAAAYGGAFDSGGGSRYSDVGALMRDRGIGYSRFA